MNGMMQSFAAMNQPRAAPHRDRDLDRKDSPPTRTAAISGLFDSDQFAPIMNTTAALAAWLQPVTYPCSSPQSPLPVCVSEIRRGPWYGDSEDDVHGRRRAEHGRSLDDCSCGAPEGNSTKLMINAEITELVSTCAAAAPVSPRTSGIDASNEMVAAASDSATVFC